MWKYSIRVTYQDTDGILSTAKCFFDTLKEAKEYLENCHMNTITVLGNDSMYTKCPVKEIELISNKTYRILKTHLYR